jgi:hypothetical protein
LISFEALATVKESDNSCGAIENAIHNTNSPETIFNLYNPFSVKNNPAGFDFLNTSGISSSRKTEPPEE